MKRFAALLVVALTASAVGCGWGHGADDVVATYRGGQVTFADIDAAILELPSDQRRPPGGDYIEWYRGLARTVALRRIVQAEARREGLDTSPEFRELEQGLRKRVTVGLFLKRLESKMDPVRDEEVRAFYDAHRSELRRPAQRQVFQIFKRVEPGASAEDQRGLLEQLRRRVVSGESFEALAAQYSDSETRHGGGLVGWVEAGQMGPELDRIIFSLEVGTVSDPITSTSGVHLFLVTSASPEREFSFDEVKLQIRDRLHRARVAEAIEQTVGDVLPETSFVPDPEELQALLDSNDPESEVMRIGDWSMSLRELLEKMSAASLASGGQDAGLQPAAVLDSIRHQELIYLHCRLQGIDGDPEVEEQLNRVRTRELIDSALRRWLVAAVESDGQRLIDYFETNHRRFDEPLRLHVERLSVPLTSRANEHLARLERAREALDRGQLGFPELAVELGGRVEDLGWLAPAQMTALGGRMAQVVTPLAPGQYSPPWRAQGSLEMVHVVDRREPRGQAFEAVHDRVVGDYLQHHGQELLEEMIEQRLQDARFEVDPERLADLHRRRLDEAQRAGADPDGSAGNVS